MKTQGFCCCCLLMKLTMLHSINKEDNNNKKIPQPESEIYILMPTLSMNLISILAHELLYAELYSL